jgi:3-hydroxymyristoyl/3-hydroxydecanoyl-(acyl carrier protein) dehydratase
MLQLFGAFVGLCLSADLLVWAVAVDVVHFWEQVRPTSAVRLTRNALSSRVSAAWSPGAATVRMTDPMWQLPALS